MDIEDWYDCWKSFQSFMHTVLHCQIHIGTKIFCQNTPISDTFEITSQNLVLFEISSGWSYLGGQVVKTSKCLEIPFFPPSYIWWSNCGSLWPACINLHKEVNLIAYPDYIRHLLAPKCENILVNHLRKRIKCWKRVNFIVFLSIKISLKFYYSRKKMKLKAEIFVIFW